MLGYELTAMGVLMTGLALTRGRYIAATPVAACDLMA